MATSIIKKRAIIYKELYHEVTCNANSVKTYSLSELGITIPSGYILANILFSFSGVGREKVRASIAGWDFSVVDVVNTDSVNRTLSLYMRCLFYS